MHGTIGLFGLIMLGVFGIGYPSLDAFMGGAVRPTISLTGQILGAVVFFLLSFFLVCSVLDPQRLGMMPTPESTELAELNLVKVFA